MAHNRLSNYRTTWTETNGRGSVVYVHTPIVEWNEDTITLKSGGWESVTTKRKMNQSALQFGLGFGVYQRNYEWFVDTPTGETLNFVDGMELQRL
jgi:hypothetical protein|tara:strand:+ start:489 stop:773 length:285 start_codon:yes stop_codon:yes gene_type:complete